MVTKSVIIELRSSREIAAMSFAKDFDVSTAPQINGVQFDTKFPPTSIPGRVERVQAESIYDIVPFKLATEPEASTYILRAEIDDEKIDEITANENVVGVFSDPVIVPIATCSSNPVGSDADVERLLSTVAMHSIGMDGRGVLVAIVDTGINMTYLNSRGKTPKFNLIDSWVPQPGLEPGNLTVDHGTMCAYDVCIAAPKCTLLDIALLQSRANTDPNMPFQGLLSDAIRAYRHLINIMLAPLRSGERRSLVVNNSWGMFNPSWDYPPGDPRNYSDNPNHPFNRIVGDLERSGADVLFAAGNCGPDCSDPRCEGVDTNAIYGASSHPSVLCVAGVDITKTRVGYSSIGPGRLTRNKPDISAYTHFSGSGVYTIDSGTSAASPVLAGIVAAVRSKRPYDPANPATHPAAIRSLVTTTAEDLSPAGYDFQHGYGVVNGSELQRRFAQQPPINDSWSAEDLHKPSVDQQRQVELS